MSNFRPVPKVLKKKTKKDRGNPAQARKEIAEMDGEFCVICGTSQGLQTHRIVYASQGGKYHANNCVLLCMEDHAIVHSNKSYWLPILQQHVEERGVE